MRTMLKRQWFQWTARKEDNSGVVMSGKTPEEAIRKLREQKHLHHFRDFVKGH